jgi:hypothetical protein
MRTKTLTRATWIATIAMLLAATAAGAHSSLDRAGIWTPSLSAPTPPIQISAGGLINDGSFEQGPPPTSEWNETNGTTCERIGDFSSSWYVSAYHGANDYWAGGYCDQGSGNVPIVSSVTQTLTIPNGNTQLSFYYIAFRPDADDAPVDGDHAYVKVNGVEVWSLPLVRASDTYPNWSALVTVDLSSYAGQSVTLAFGGTPEGNLTGNLRFDYVSLAAPAAVDPVTWGAIKALYH